MPQQFRRLLLSLASLLVFVAPVFAGRLAIVIDDFGYHPYTKNQVLAMPSTISATVLLNAPHACEMVIKAYNSGHGVLIRLLMVPLNKQPLEKDVLCPEMSSEEIERIIRNAVSKVPNAVGLDDHMSSAMTSNLFGAQKVIQALGRCDLYFLGSATIGNNQAIRVTSGTGVKAIRRKIFLGDTQNEADIRRQFNRVVELTRRNGFAIAIGHPHLSTARVLQQMLCSLPADITLVHPSNLLNEPQVGTFRPNLTPPKNGMLDELHNPFRGAKLCKPKRPLKLVYASRSSSILGESIAQGTLVQYMRLQW